MMKPSASGRVRLRCCVRGCAAYSSGRFQHRRFFSFPDVIDLRKQWINAINLIKPKGKGGKPWKPTTRAAVCSSHFQDGEPTTLHPIPDVDLVWRQTPAERCRKKKWKG